MSNGPLPSKRCMLSELPARAVGDKVRFLGCVDSYGTRTGLLTLKHSFPSSSNVRASVDVKLLLQCLNTGQTDVGRWVHVMGYVTSITKPRDVHRNTCDGAYVGVQALVLWPADDLDISAYEDSVSKPVT
ncbi:hypothetical protein SUNI508_10573 [Seiridium unicorne]|uniref:Uncharacterized protein n=1 Tax=Seiridium unicorne TaxID=138068 RepID=A0ABR2UL77_9PEZI